MKVHKYTAKSSRDALRQVREDLGPDAVILANRRVRNGVELLAMPAPLQSQAPAVAALAAAQAALPLPLEMSEADVVGDRTDALAEAALGSEPAFGPVSGRRAQPDPAALRPPFPQREVAHAPAVLRRRARAPEPDWTLAVPQEVEPVGRAALAQGAARVRGRERPLRHQTGRPREDALSTYSAAPTSAAPTADAKSLADLAAAHDPLMARLAEEVRALGGLLGKSEAVLAASPRAADPAARSAEAAGGTDPREQAAGAAGDHAASSNEWVSNVMGELRAMRVLIEDQIGNAAFQRATRSSPGALKAVRTLSAAGFSAPLIRKITSRLQDGVSEADAGIFLRNALVNNLNVAASESALLDEGGVVALVGPTGAGKTTTAAKLAARFVLRHGAANLALLTTDGYRIAGQEQLRIYGKILGVAVYAVKDGEDLKRTLAELRQRKLVLIDTVGLSQRDRMVAEQHSMFAACGVPVKRLLLLNATCHGETLNDVVKAYQGDGLAGCIISKMDEAASLGSALEAAIRHRLRLFYVADGQRVPEDLQLADARSLVERALRTLPNDAGFGALDLDFPVELPPPHTLGAAREFHSTGGLAAGGLLHG